MTWSPGERKFTTIASMAPVPPEVRMRTSFLVWNSVWRLEVTRLRIAANSGPRWLIIWRLIA